MGVGEWVGGWVVVAVVMVWVGVLCMCVVVGGRVGFLEWAQAQHAPKPDPGRVLWAAMPCTVFSRAETYKRSAASRQPALPRSPCAHLPQGAQGGRVYPVGALHRLCHRDRRPILQRQRAARRAPEGERCGGACCAGHSNPGLQHTSGLPSPLSPALLPGPPLAHEASLLTASAIKLTLALSVTPCDRPIVPNTVPAMSASRSPRLSYFGAAQRTR